MAESQRHPGPPDHGGEPHTRTVLAFYDLAFNQGNPREAVARYVGPVYTQHNPLAPDGAEAFIQFVEGFRAQFPQLHVDVKRTVAAGDLVVTHVHLTLGPEDRGSAVMDIFRLDRGKIVEHWDVVQPIPETAANDNTMF